MSMFKFKVEEVNIWDVEIEAEDEEEAEDKIRDCYEREDLLANNPAYLALEYGIKSVNVDMEEGGVNIEIKGGPDNE